MYPTAQRLTPTTPAGARRTQAPRSWHHPGQASVDYHWHRTKLWKAHSLILRRRGVTARIYSGDHFSSFHLAQLH